MGKDVVKKGARRWLRPALWTIFGVWAVIIVVLQIALNSKVLTRVVNDVAKEYVDGDVTFTGIKASMFKSFPNLNVTIDNFSITYPHDRFAAFDSLDVPGGYLRARRGSRHPGTFQKVLRLGQLPCRCHRQAQDPPRHS